MARHLYHSVYFTLENQADLELLRWILAIPPSRRGRILKAVLLEALPRYLKRHDPGIPPLPPTAVPAAVEQARRPRRQPRAPRPGREDGAPEPRLIETLRGDGNLASPIDEPAAAPSQTSEPDRRQEAERKLDRLLRSLTR